MGFFTVAFRISFYALEIMIPAQSNRFEVLLRNLAEAPVDQFQSGYSSIGR